MRCGQVAVIDERGSMGPVGKRSGSDGESPSVQGQMRSLLEEVRADLKAQVVALYRLDATGGYASVLSAEAVEPTDGVCKPAYVASASDLASYLRRCGTQPFSIECTTFKDGPVRRGLAAFGIQAVAVAPLDGALRSRYFLTAGLNRAVREDDEALLAQCAVAVEEMLVRLSLQARVRGSVLPVLGDGASDVVARTTARAFAPLLTRAMGGGTFQEVVEQARRLLDDESCSVAVEDSSRRLLAADGGSGGFALTSDWLMEFPQLPYLDWMEEARRPVFVPEGEKATGWLVIPLVAGRDILGMVLTGPIDRAAVEERAEIFADLRFAVTYLLKVRDASRIRVLRNSLRSVENERARVAVELHDETSQNLVALKVRLATALRAFREGSEQEALGAIEDCTCIADGILDGVNRLASELWPSELAYLGLRQAIEAQAVDRLGRAGVAFTITGNATETRFSSLQESMLLSGVAEAFSNCVRHGHARTVEVEMHDDGHWWTVIVRDDGQGFDVARPKGTGFGLKAMADCAEAIGGDFWIGSVIGEGTTVRFAVPRTELEEADHE